MQPFCNFVGNGHAAAGQTENYHVVAPCILIELLRQLPAGLCSIFEHSFHTAGRAALSCRRDRRKQRLHIVRKTMDHFFKTLLNHRRKNPSFMDFATETRSEEHTSELQSHSDLVCRLLLEKKKKNIKKVQ